MDLPDLLVESREQWRAWLGEHGPTSRGVWVVTWKRQSGGPHVPYDDVVEEALAAGWIDSRPRIIDEHRSARLVTPRGPGSRWSRLNKQRVERLLEAGLMRPEGLAVVAAAQASGTWTALDDVEELLEPPDLVAALDAVPAAREHWQGFPRSARRAILEWVTSARTAPTRAARVEQTVASAARGERANQWRPRTRDE
ncbi:uncharacterized protein YdeI (YjbR/CyaY-like superfamily) [Motilibacter rhizosphaerae]|uniref:Uncharacterized protein YdeI (YjbR/CyaY-like superfamily) n=1 Tax=Motilibacter rhizosphaerae TaxID=598652 RepID=A0A4Q7NZ61_9ACTN|nr:YdeI/OmpD-associated family protein [Motilibacter rhizosphaerae]RZS91712.1 uncharacterized protein YdeI (YjbR/CyaY-like superfamily) [Motilibacter rhizosphaerae]